MILKLSLDLPEETSYIRLTRLVGKTVLEYMSVSEIDVADMEMILEELCSNVVRHAHSQEGRFSLKLEYHANRVVIIVKDKGNGFTFSDIPPPGTKRLGFDGEERVGGYGLTIVGTLSDRLQFGCTDGKGTTVRAEKRLTYRTQAALKKAEAMDEEDGDASAMLSSS